MADPKQPNAGDERTILEAPVLTPPGPTAAPGAAGASHDIGEALTVAPKPPSAGGTAAKSTSAFKGGIGTGGLDTAPQASVKAQDLLEDKLILSAPRVEVNGQKIPMLGGIHLLAKLGQGGMGAVYFGVHPRLHQEVAVKVLPFHLAEQEPGLVQRFIREAQIAAKVRSPHLVGVIDVNEENGLFYLVMEFVSGKSAGEYLRDVTLSGAKGLAEKTALAICIGAAEGLAVAHAHGVIHRDIKPDNIMIPRAFISSTGAGNGAKPVRPEDAPFDFPKAKLADLGLARNETGDQSMTAVNVCMGTPGFMSPEQANDAKHASKPADVFSLGATLYALLAGDSPFKGTSLMQTLNLTVNEKHAPVTHLRADVSMRTSQMLDRCLAKKATDRYHDATALLIALRQCYDAIDTSLRTFVYDASPGGAPGAAQPGSAIQRPVSSVITAGSGTPEPTRKSGWLAVVAVILLLGVLASAVGGYFVWQKMEQDKKNALIAAEKDRIERENLQASRKVDEMREAAYKEELTMIDGWMATQHSADTMRRERIREQFAVGLKASNEFRRSHNFDKAIATLEDALKLLGTTSSTSRATALELLREMRDERAQAQDAFTAAYRAATEAKRDQNLPKTIQLLEDAFKALGAQPHTSRTMAELMLTEARKDQRAQLDAFSAAYKTALELKKDQKIERMITALDDGLKMLGQQSHPDRIAAETLLREAKDDRDHLKRKETMALEALPAALTAAAEYKRAHNWDGVLLALEEPLKAIGDQPHSNRATIEAWIKEAKEQKERVKQFKAGIDKGTELIKAQNYDAAKTEFENTRQFAVDPPEIQAVADGLKRTVDGAKRVRSTQARMLMLQGKKLRPDNKNAREPDWAKAAEAFKGAAAIYTEIEEKDDLARANLEQADCYRKDLNKNGDWAQAAALYSTAAGIFANLGDKKGQAEAISKHATCLDPSFNTAGDVRIAANLYGRAALLFGEVGIKRAMADNLSRQATCITKEKNILNSAERAGEIFKRAALLYEELGEKKAQGLCIFNEAACLIREKKQNMTPEARALFTRAAKISKEAGDDATAKLAEDLLK